MNRRKLIISPQAGMCNRFRALCAALAIGKLSQRQVFHNWQREDPHPADIPIVQQMRCSCLDDFFAVSDLPFYELSASSRVDAIYSEWLPEDDWFPRQSSAIRRLGGSQPIHRIRTNANALLADPSETILLETSLAVRPDYISRDEFDGERTQVYRRFEALPKFQSAADKMTPTDPFLAVHVRRTDHLGQHEQANISLRGWVEVIKQTFRSDALVYVCSDDLEAKRQILAEIPHRHFALDYDACASLGAQRDAAFLEFLILSRAEFVLGTVGSSFGAEAAIFGGKSFRVVSRE